jgi:hypothetical protein
MARRWITKEHLDLASTGSDPAEHRHGVMSESLIVQLVEGDGVGRVTCHDSRPDALRPLTPVLQYIIFRKYSHSLGPEGLE